MSYFISCTASILSLASLAIERYLAIRSPHKYRSNLTGRRILSTVAFIWLVATCLPFIYFKVHFITCAFILTNTTVLLALATMAFTQGLMIWKLKRTHRHHPSKTENLAQVEIQSTPDYTNRTIDMETKITKMFLVVMTAVLCCYGPRAILIYVTSFCESCSCTSLHWFRDLQCLFILANSSMNFFFYGLRSPRYRRAFTEILRLPGRRKYACNIVFGYNKPRMACTDV